MQLACIVISVHLFTYIHRFPLIKLANPWWKEPGIFPFEPGILRQDPGTRDKGKNLGESRENREGWQVCVCRSRGPTHSLSQQQMPIYNINVYENMLTCPCCCQNCWCHGAVVQQILFILMRSKLKLVFVNQYTHNNGCFQKMYLYNSNTN